MQNFVLGLVSQGGSSPNNFEEFLDEKNYKFSSGIEGRINGFSFYSYPTAIEYSLHIPVLDDSNYNPKQYLKILFNF